ncbi:MAG: hypothetical protein A2279_06680 [Stygiobacter sp. RIFOXYA12_FULL_38_9]|nr:MAG: hypothetical protein FD122_1981 [Stygiobacter sp.]KAF0213469.1 MAG: hypothetical protein FD178_2846 [Ignavibacteria bacterium]OGU66453.1 MAG: hypothetical protein A2X62_04640 [Stygiobacter sp. GWC2_38_9]OGU82999.1 MAG: hypothetical protein A2279_06680 [Stygiobacter sp. RIFOXYA12_FULL_38_9]OGV08349.1 MAG: hypothetical protein A2299_13095 [Stygiobacter sp. RIFOXYB2_FULL_37_11]OGV13931.1 MAG: hypothetical protein A2440_12320 [Stygiobacter sp. RIFOXYC2_FULL_38_25]OGV15409.1 MAG: hypotheti
MAKTQKSLKETKKNFVSPFQEYWTNKNYLFLLGGLAVLILGYFLMAQSPWDGFSSLTLSPLILLAGYVVVIPFAIMVKSSFFKK